MAFVLLPHLLVFILHPLREILACAFAHEIAGHRHAAARIDHVHGGAAVVRRNAHGGVHTACGGTADQQGRLQTATFHLARNLHHFVQRWCDQAAQSDHVHVPFRSGVQDLFRRHHHAQIDHFPTIASEDHAHDVLADVVHITFHRGQQDPL